jgi:hypothetical protein
VAAAYFGFNRVLTNPIQLVTRVFFSVLYQNEERRLKVFENRVLRRVFGPKRDEVTGMEKIT